MSKRITDEELFERARAFHRKRRRVPHSTELGESVKALVPKRFGSWQNYIQRSLGMDAERHYWTDEELLALLVDLKRKLNRFPTWQDLRNVKKSLTETIRTRFGGLSAALEKATGDSPRLAALRCLADLTTPRCEEATTGEIVAETHAKGYALTKHLVGIVLDDARRSGLVEGGKYDQSSWWRLTGNGRRLLEKDHKPKGAR